MFLIAPGELRPMVLRIERDAPDAIRSTWWVRIPSRERWIKIIQAWEAITDESPEEEARRALRQLFSIVDHVDNFRIFKGGKVETVVMSWEDKAQEFASEDFFESCALIKGHLIEMLITCMELDENDVKNFLPPSPTSTGGERAEQTTKA